MRRFLLLVPLIGALFASVVACGSGGDSKSSAATAVPTKPAAAAAATTSAPAVQEITLKASEKGEDYMFDQKQLKVKPGTVRITLVNDGPERPHSIDVKGKDGNSDLAKVDRVEVGQKATIEFTATDEGTYNFLCTIRGHADRGMTGTIVVSKT